MKILLSFLFLILVSISCANKEANSGSAAATPKSNAATQENTEKTKAGFCTTSKGKRIKVGERFRPDKCNTCVCQKDGSVACTLKECL